MPSGNSYDQSPAHGTLSGFVGGCSCDCCRAAFAAYILDERNLFIFSPTYVSAKRWADENTLPSVGYISITNDYTSDTTRHLRGRENGYYVVLRGYVMSSKMREAILAANLRKLRG